jgi:hypothetical protein
MNRTEYVPICLGAVALLAVFLCLVNWWRSKKLLNQIRNRLNGRRSCSDSEFVSGFPLEHEKEIAIKVRRELSRVLLIDPQKILPDDDLQLDYHLNTVCPSLLGSIAFRFTSNPAKSGIQQLFRYKRASSTLRDFIRAIS